MPATSVNCLAVVLKELGWSYTKLIAELRRHAAVDKDRPAQDRKPDSADQPVGE
jgi:hypothetical protein